jgi:predicted nuclease of predicted toxin-antitoxin system
MADENIPNETVKLLKMGGVDIISATEISVGLSDRKLIEVARQNGRIIVTFDRDFGQLIFKEKLKTNVLFCLDLSLNRQNK